MRIQPRQRLSHYRLEQRIGAGGMGEVWRAVDEALGRDAAIKVLPEKFSPALSKRLIREAEVCAQLQHPAIATFFEAGVADGTSFIAMELVRGETLRRKLQGGPLSGSDALDLVTGLLEALGHAHSSGILHRDIKPENIMVTDEGLPRLLDFGLAKHIRIYGSAEATTVTRLTAPGTLLGTVGYMSPEQLRGEPLDERADLFAVAAVLYELLCGQPAFSGASPTEKLSAVLSRDPDPLDPSVASPVLDTFIRRCLSRDRERRPADAGDFLRGLRQSREGLPGATGLAPSVALLDLQNLSGNADNDWIATGIAESLAADLGRVEGLKIFSVQASRQAAAAVSDTDLLQRAQQVALRLGARWVVCGSFQKIGSRLRVISHLVEALTGETVATEKLDGAIDNMFEFQDRLGEVIVAHLDLSMPVAAAAPERKLDVFELCARAERLARTGGKESMTQAGELLERVLEVEPDHVPALTTLARMLGMKHVYTSNPEFPRRAIEYAKRALVVDPDSVETLVWLGYARFQIGEYDESAKHFSRALEIEPGNYTAAYFYASHFLLPMHSQGIHRQQRQMQPPGSAAKCVQTRRKEEARRLLQIAVQDPRKSGFSWLGLGICHIELGHFENGLWCLEQARQIEMEGEGFVLAGIDGYIGECLRLCNRLDEAMQRVMAGLQQVEKSDHFYRDTLRGIYLNTLGKIGLDRGDQAAARAAFQQAAQHLRGRSKARGVGQLLVQALAGQARTDGDAAALGEARRLFDERSDYNFEFMWGCREDISLLELARAAWTLRQTDLARDYLERARDLGCFEARREDLR